MLHPADRKLDIETVGAVPEATVIPRGLITERRWRVDQSPPAPEEPEAPSPREFLPSVRVGWGINLEEVLRRYVDMASEETPLDPRLRTLARPIAAPFAPSDREGLARAAYKYVSDNIQEGKDNDGRRTLTGRAGSRQSAFFYLMRLLGIPAEVALVKSRIAMPAKSPLSEAEVYDNALTRLDTGTGSPRWLTLQDKFAPFGYVPAELRGQPAIRLVAGSPRETIPALGDSDGVRFSGRAVLAEDGSASVELVASYIGRMAIGVRSIFDKVAESKRREFVETRLLANHLGGARLTALSIENKDALSEPLVVRMTASTTQLVRDAGNGKKQLRAMFPAGLLQLASLAERQTPLLLAASSHVEVSFSIVMPVQWQLPASLPTGELRDQDRSVIVRDTVEGNALRLSRVIDLPAGRVAPGAEYGKFVAFAQAADQLLAREVMVGAPASR